MPPVSSFDVTSTVDLQEVDNAVNQARKEIAQRYDFKGSTAAIDFKKTENTLNLSAEDNMKLNALWDVLQTRLIRRNVAHARRRRRHVGQRFQPGRRWRLRQHERSDESECNGT